jgi:hypothetical protein
VPSSVLNQAPFNLAWGAQVYAQIIAYNIYGNSTVSSPGSGAIILTSPAAPVNLAENVVARTATSVGLSFSSGATNGGAAVIDFTVSYDQATGVWVDLQSNVLGTNYTASGLNTGSTYSFKVQSRNSYGLSSYSNLVTIMVATVPAQPLTPVTSVVAD